MGRVTIAKTIEITITQNMVPNKKIIKTSLSFISNNIAHLAKEVKAIIDKGKEPFKMEEYRRIIVATIIWRSINYAPFNDRNHCLNEVIPVIWQKPSFYQNG